MFPIDPAQTAVMMGTDLLAELFAEPTFRREQHISCPPDTDSIGA